MVALVDLLPPGLPLFLDYGISNTTSCSTMLHPLGWQSIIESTLSDAFVSSANGSSVADAFDTAEFLENIYGNTTVIERLPKVHIT